MPGLIGFTRKPNDRKDDVLRSMQELMRHQPFYVEDPHFCDDYVCATRTHKDVVQRGEQPFRDEGVHVWLKGEFCNREKLVRFAGSNARELSDPGLLAQLYQNEADFGFLREIDGIYSAVIYDTIANRVHLITDRYGIGYLYWTVCDRRLLWGSETKVFLAHPRFKPLIDPQTVQDFTSAGYAIGNRTWFDGVELVPPGTVVSWDIREEKLDKKVYWSWDDIGLLDQPIDENEVSEELGRLWIDAVRRRTHMEGGKVGITLSGGLDSRAILAAMPNPGYPIHAVTVGDERCEDVRIARKVARLKSAVHHVYSIDGDNWLNLRPNAVWWSDGHLAMNHLHGCVVIDKIGALFDINMSGIAGGPIMGGLYVSRSNGNRHEEFTMLSGKARRFSPCMVQSIDDVFFDSRIPFLDNALVEMIMSVPGEYRDTHSIYSRTLLANFPEFYKRIRWQKTGLPIGASSFKKSVKGYSDGVVHVADRVLQKLTSDRLGLGRNQQFHDYANWLRRDPGKRFVEQILTSPTRLYPEFIDGQSVVDLWTTHQEGRNRARRLLHYVTFEVWLQQVFEGRYRSSIMQAAVRANPLVPAHTSSVHA